MTQVLQLTNLSGSVVLDLLQGPFRLTAGFDFATPGQGGVFVYEPYGAQFDFGNFQPHTETFSLGIRGQRATVISAMNDLQNFLEMVRLFNDGDLAAESCWLKWAADGEEEKWSLLYGGTFKVLSQDNVTPGLGECVVTGALSLTRHPLWENTEVKAVFDTGVVSTLGGKYDYTNIDGNTLARLYQTRIYPDVGDTISRAWIGIRRYNQGVTNFNPIWECEDGTNIAADTADAPDVTASPGGAGNTKVTTTFAVGGLVERFQIAVIDVDGAPGTNAAEFQGRYLVLARCKVVGAGGVAGIQMHYGFGINEIGEEVYISNTSWRLIPLGNISISPWEGARYSTRDFMVYYTISIWAEELVTCDLDMDCLVLIPNEHMVEYIASLSDPSPHGRLDILEDDIEVAYKYSSANLVVSATVEFATTDWYLPPGDGTIICAAEQTGPVHTLGTNMRTYFYHVPRWTLYRGE